MNKRKKLIILITLGVLIIAAITASTYAYLLAMTNEEDASTGSGMLGINYNPPADIGGMLVPTSDRNGGLFTTTTASLETGSEKALFNMYITPTSLTNMNIAALKWESEGLRDTNNDGVLDTVCAGSGDFSNASVNKDIVIIDHCELDYTDTVFNIYIWLDSNLLDTSLDGATFGAKIGADSVNITGTY